MNDMNLDDVIETPLVSLVGERVLDAVDRSTAQVKKWGDEYEKCQVLRFRLDGVVYTAVEDPSDGYRSSLDKLFASAEPMANVFAPCRVLVRLSERGEYGAKNDTLELLDMETGKTVLRVGTDNYDDYYPCFIDEFNPQNMAANAGDTV